MGKSGERSKRVETRSRREITAANNAREKRRNSYPWNISIATSVRIQGEAIPMRSIRPAGCSRGIRNPRVPFRKYIYL